MGYPTEDDETILDPLPVIDGSKVIKVWLLILFIFTVFMLYILR